MTERVTCAKNDGTLAPSCRNLHRTSMYRAIHVPVHAGPDRGPNIPNSLVPHSRVNRVTCRASETCRANSTVMNPSIVMNP